MRRRPDPDDPEQLVRQGAPADHGPLFAPANLARGIEGSERAARKWNEAERALVEAVVVKLCRTRWTFTASDVWDALGPAFPVTKGLTAVLIHAQRQGWCVATSRTVRCGRGGPHDHAQRLTVWQSLTYKHPEPGGSP